ncbi:DUF1559 domain-containing protein [Anatilimnocola floriformis]|uniref:DUF1559 domain-containing protein n=1 Tax=Anatilimnocola floriformis TaxID=2948575 RepID=UPI0020C2D04C|nr:DUF1559 domain-containing protein [Anatilimnocola floriformis]
MSRKGLTLVEAIVVIIVLVVLVALFLPVHRGAPHAARRMQCGNNMKQLVLGLQNYHDIFLQLPYGARSRTTSDNDERSFGSSWIVATLPFCEQRPLFDKVYGIDLADPANDYASDAVRQLALNAKIKYLLCPSSQLPEMQQAGGFSIVLPSYAGIMGATEHSGMDITAIDQYQRIVVGPFGGHAAANGMLPINESLKFEDCKDGTANTIIVGEVSDWYYDNKGTKQNPALSAIDPQSKGRIPGGWLAGTNLDFKVEKDGKPVPADRVFNLITLDQSVGTNNRGGIKDGHPNWGTSGVGRCGLNNPLLSAHPAGAMVGFLDGHVLLLTKQVSPHIVKRLAIRDDGGEIPDF